MSHDLKSPINGNIYVINKIQEILDFKKINDEKINKNMRFLLS